MATADGGNIMYRKKQLGNGDIEKDIQSSLKQKKQSNALKTQLKKMTQTMNEYDKAKTNDGTNSQFKPFSKTRKRREKDKFHHDVKQVARNQKHLNDQLNQVPFNKKNPNVFFSKNKRLPDSLLDIDDNIELAKLLLKNPEKMTDEEKVYISSFNNREFKLFISYLKMKQKELNWQGNGYGSGHYSEGFISIYRQHGQNENERYSSLKKFLKLNYQNTTDKKKAVTSGSMNGFQQEEGFNTADCNANMDDGMISKPHATQNDDYIRQAKEIQNQMSSFTKILDWHKNEADLNRFKNKNDLMNKELESKTNYLKDDLEKVKGYKKNEAEALYQQYIANGEKQFIVNNNNETIDKKIKEYLIRMRLTSYELAKKFSEAAQFDDFEKGMVDIPTAQKQFVTLLILTQDEAKELCNLMIKFNGMKIRTEFFADFIDRDIKAKSKEKVYRNNNEFDEEEIYGGDNANPDDYDYEDEVNEEEDIEDYSYDGDNNYFGKKIRDKDHFKKTVIAKHLGDFETIMMKKGVTQIQKMVRGCIVRKKVKSERIHVYILVKRICKLLRLNYERQMLLKNCAVRKIVAVLRQRLQLKKANKEYKSRWTKVKDNKFESVADVKMPLVNQNNNETNWQNSQVTLKNELLKTKICFLCLTQNVTHLCRDCNNNHYCERCFKQYHMHGDKKSHVYFTTTELFDECKIALNPRQINEIQLIKDYLKQKDLQLNEILPNWDFKKNGTIRARHLKDALGVKGYSIDKEYQIKIFNYALGYATKGKAKDQDVNDYIIDLSFTNSLIR